MLYIGTGVIGSLIDVIYPLQDDKVTFRVAE